jgi:hypothetical protein
MFGLILAIYICIGILMALIGPARKSIDKAVNEIKPKAFDSLSGRNAIPTYKIYLFQTILTIGFILLWPMLLPSVIKDNSPNKIENDDDDDEEKLDGIKFSYMGGVGILTCKNCNYRKNITSFIHGSNSCTTGFQCQSCGKFRTRSRLEPFEDIHIDDSKNLLDFTPKERASKIEHMQAMLTMCENSMKENPKNKWLPTWEPTVKSYKEKLSHIPTKEIENIRKTREKFEKKYEASLVCSCGGKLDRDQILFCPECKSKELDYFMEYIT